MQGSTKQEISRKRVLSKTKANFDADGASYLRHPSEQIYQKEKMPVVFQTEQFAPKLATIRRKIENNISEAFFLADKHNMSNGLLGKASRIMSGKVRRPLTAQTNQSFGSNSYGAYGQHV